MSTPVVIQYISVAMLSSAIPSLSSLAILNLFSPVSPILLGCRPSWGRYPQLALALYPDVLKTTIRYLLVIKYRFPLPRERQKMDNNDREE